MRLGGELKKERRRRGILQAGAASEMKVSQQTVAKWENGGRPDPEYLPAIASFLQRSVDEVAVMAYSPEESADALERIALVEAEIRALRADVARLLDLLEPRLGRERP